MNKLDIIKALLCESQSEQVEKKYPFKIGDKVFIRTITVYFLGRITDIKANFLKLENASWVQDTGSRLYDFLNDGIANNSEIEPIGISQVNLDTVVDIIEWKHALPKEQK